jgi:hypothetical protein
MCGVDITCGVNIQCELTPGLGIKLVHGNYVKSYERNIDYMRKISLIDIAKSLHNCRVRGSAGCGTATISGSQTLAYAKLIQLDVRRILPIIALQ